MPDFDYQQSATPKQLYEMLLSRNFEIDILDSSGQRITDPETAEVFSFDYKTENKNYGTVVILLSNEKTLEMFYSDNLGRSMERNDKEGWYDFLYQVRMFAKRNLLSFELKNMNKLKYTMQGMAALKEGLFESYYGNKKTSYTDGPQKTRLIINHNKQLENNDPRYRYIESIFVETADGERFKLPFTKLAAGRAMARHVSEGGKPYDPLGQHICGMVEQINKLGKFVRKLGNRELTAESDLAQSAHEEYDNVRRQLKSMASLRGYRKFKECWNPTEITVAESVANQVDKILVTESYTSKGKPNMKEVKLFENWVNLVAENKQIVPDTPAAIQTFKELMSQPLVVGPDAINAEELLFDIIGDEDLLRRLDDLANQDPEADARQVVIDWLQENQHKDPALAAALQAVSDAEQPVSEEIGDPTDDPEFYGDNEGGNEFYVAIYDEDENTTFVGGVRQDDRRWEEFKVAGRAPTSWGNNGYMSYLSANDVMNWIHKDFDRGYEVAGPFWSRQEAIQHAQREFGPLGEAEETDSYMAGYSSQHNALTKKQAPKNPHQPGTLEYERWADEEWLGRDDRRREMSENFRNEYQAHGHFAAQRNLPNKQFTDFAEWRKFISSFEPAVKFFKKATQHGEIIVAKDGARVLGSFNPANKFGFIGEQLEEAFPYDVDHMPGAVI